MQVGEQSIGRLTSHNILKERPGHSSYARRTCRLEIVRVPGFYLLTSLYLNTSLCAPSPKLIDKPETNVFV